MVSSQACVDSGRESFNECDSSLEDSSLNYEMLASSSSSPKSRFFVDAISADDDQQVVSKKPPCSLDFYASSGSQSKWYLPPSVTGSSSDVIKINITSSDMDTCLMTVSTASIAQPESSTVTPPSDSQAGQDDEMSACDKT